MFQENKVESEKNSLNSLNIPNISPIIINEKLSFAAENIHIQDGRAHSVVVVADAAIPRKTYGITKKRVRESDPGDEMFVVTKKKWRGN